MKNIFKLCILIIFCLQFTTQLFSQVSSRGIPISIQNNLEVTIPVVTLPYLSNEAEKERADSAFNAENDSCTECRMGNSYYGSGIDISINIKNSGQMLILEDSSKLWLLEIESSTAYGMQFYFDKFNIPYGATLFFYNEDSSILGAYTSRNNPLDTTLAIPFGTQYIKGKNIIVEYHEPYNSDFSGELEITRVIHIFNEMSGHGPFSVGGSMSCEINVSCPLGDGWEKEISSVALILGYDATNNLMNVCSGTLINNTSEDGRPLFLTAYHCMNDNWVTNPEADYHSWIFLFNHETSDCLSDGSEISGSLAQSVFGSTLLSANGGGTNSDPDYLLLELNTIKEDLEIFGVCYAGWTLDLPPQGPFIGIHHPRGDVKKISKASLIVDYNTSYWKVDWDPNEGTIEHGSSGSPLFDVDHRIIGQLFWAVNFSYPDFCDPYLLAGYNKFSASWSNSGLSGFALFLDPNNTGQTHIDTYCPGLVWQPQSGLGGVGGGAGGCGDLPNGGGEGNNCVSNLSYRGMKINGIGLGVQVPQISDPIILTGIPRCACTNGYWDTDVSSVEYDCSSLPNSACFHSFPDFWNCYCPHVSHFIELIEVDQNLNWISSPHSGWIDELVDQWWWWWDQINIDQNTINIIDMPLTHGKYYRIRLAYYLAGNLYQSTRFFYYNGTDMHPQLRCFGTDITVTAASVNNFFPYIYTNKLGASNSITTSGNILITGTKHWTAGSSIEFNQGFEVQSGSDFFAEIYSCDGGARVADTNNIHSQVPKKHPIKKSYSSYQPLKEKETREINNNNFAIIPNPNTGIFNFENFSSAPKNISIFDTKGSKVYESINQNMSFPIDLSANPKGVYFIKVIENEKISVSKIVIQ